MFLLDILYNSFTNYLIFNLTFYISNALLFIIDHFMLMTKYKIQENRMQTNEMLKYTYKKTIPTVLQNSLINIIPIFLVAGTYETNYKESFSVFKFGYDVLIARILAEIFFYTAHRMFHLNTLYQKYHKKHHEITSPVGITSIYMTVPDLYFGNILPVYLPLLILNAHPITIKFWIVATTLNTIFFAHSGFDKIANSHDYHHSHFNKNFGTDLFMDKLFGTHHG